MATIATMKPLTCSGGWDSGERPKRLKAHHEQEHRAAISYHHHQQLAGGILNAVGKSGTNLCPMMESAGSIKQIRLDESRSLTIRSGIRNLLNHTNFIIQQSNLRADLETFGQVLSSAPGRNIQFSARYSF